MFLLYSRLTSLLNPGLAPIRLLFIALALLPEGTDIGTRLHYEWMSYSIVE
jgi:hypothetical protein